jgi:hypothetical protein
MQRDALSPATNSGRPDLEISHIGQIVRLARLLAL